MIESQPSCHEARCTCGQLVAKMTDHGVEVKCKRCKRMVLLPYSSLDSKEKEINLCGQQ